jgi:hypothetical protein
VAELVLRAHRSGNLGARSALEAWPALIGFLPITLLAAAQGGYFPSAWGWATVGLLWASGIAVVLRSSVQVSGAERAFALAWLGLVAWIALSTVWSRNLPQTVLEIERTLVYVGGVWAVVVLGRSGSARRLLGGLLVAISVIALFSLATRLFPGQLRVYDRTAVYRLAQPIGYWNGLAVFTAMGAILALGFAARGRLLVVRVMSAAVLVFLLPTFYFTFGRGGWIALGVGTAVVVLVDSRRLQLVATLLVLTPACAVAIWLATDSPGLTRSGATAARAAHDGHRLALWLLLLAALSGTAAAVVCLLERRLVVPARARRIFGVALVLGFVMLLVGVFLRYGGPHTLAREGYSAFKAPPPHVVDLNRRLLSFSGNGRYELWRLAWENARRHPWLGSGAGTYERYFLKHQPAKVGRVRDAHGLYIETLAELGPVGLALLVGALAVPLVVAVRVRRDPIVPAAAGAYGTFLVHALVDWDWEIPAVTLTALMCGGAILLTGRRDGGTRPLSLPVRGVAVAATVLVGALAAIGLVGNSAVRASDAARRAGDWDRAASEARTARTWQPWSPRPWLALGEAQLGAGLVADARASFRRAASIDPGDWSVWYELARASTGPARIRALERAVALYPRSGLLAGQHAATRRRGRVP